MKNNYIGCSGFIYPEWKGRFYPADLARSKWISHYSSKFNTLELNATFYRFPVVKNLQALYKATPAEFKITVKANKIITHTLRMKNAKEKVDEFMKIVEEGLQEKLGCVLFQLPPSFKYTPENLQNILDSVPLKITSVVELRNASWWTEDVYETLEKHGITFCNNDYPGMPNTIIATKKLFYMRFHGKPILYTSEYSTAHLKKLVRQIPVECKERYVYFNNTASLAAITNAISIREMME